MKTRFRDVSVGTVFEYENAIFVALPFDYEVMQYGALCIRGYTDYEKDIEYVKGDTVFFHNEDFDVDSIVFVYKRGELRC